MRLQVALAALYSAASALSIYGGDQTAIANDDLKIPGDSPLELCEGDHSDDLLKITSVDLEPNPPEASVNPVNSPREYHFG
jgi:hypothetical protein